ncbi:unnamed protein product [Adineta ricciae]|uniref:adenylate kinase n=1 Tax=Adineta ricciae TaxID=249248 RepID=A0A814NVY2_ADIRI|nr:unnamed protein product [Adineta ricciae]CAF1574016.1 unnamed protein product [Adineta ricciae]
MSNTKPNVIFVIGAPGSGKGTQCKRIAKTFDYVHLSIGDLLRKEAERSDTDLGKQLKDHMKNGSLASTELVCKLLDEAMKKENKRNYLIDGFPRDKQNVDGWDKAMSDKVNLQCVLVFDCDEKTSTTRCLERGKSSGRADDNEESLKKRLVTYNESTRPIIELYETENLAHKIDASKDVDQIFEHVQNIMKNLK